MDDNLLVSIDTAYIYVPVPRQDVYFWLGSGGDEDEDDSDCCAEDYEDDSDYEEEYRERVNARMGGMDRRVFIGD